MESIEKKDKLKYYKFLKQIPKKINNLYFGKLKGKFISVPDRDEITEPLNEQLIVELYSK